MSQQYPFLQNGQALPQAQNFYAQQGGMNTFQPGGGMGTFPTGYGQPGMMPGQAIPQGMQGIDPAMLAQAQQAMANPDDGDGFGILPGPQDAAIGAIGGASVALGLNYLDKHQLIDKVATGMEKIPGVGWVNGRIDEQMAKVNTWGNKGINPSVKEMLHAHTFDEVNKLKGLTPDQLRQKLIQTAKTSPAELLRQRAIEAAQKIDDTVARDKAVKAAQEMSEKELRGKALAKIQKMKPESLHTQAVRDAAQASVSRMQQRQLGTTLENFQKYFSKPEHAKAYQAMRTEMATKSGQKTLNLIPKAGLKPDKAFFGTVLSSADEQIKFLSEKAVKTPNDKYLLKVLHNLKERVSGLNNNYLPVYKEQVALSARLQAKNVGPIGRMFANGVNYLKRIFNGETLRMGGKAAAKTTLWNRVTQLGLPAMAGALIFGQSIQKARKAKEGEKTKTFFHDFIGVGIANFIGWEFGRKLLNSSQFANKLLGKRALSTLGRAVPLIGGITLGGFVTEIIAMFVIGSVFQKAGELISHKIFGKPSDESIEGKAKKQDAQQQQMQQMQQQQAQDLAQAKKRGADPARREKIKGILPEPGTKFPKRPSTNLTPDMIRQSRAAQEQSRIDQAFLNTPWNHDDHVNPYISGH